MVFHPSRVSPCLGSWAFQMWQFSCLLVLFWSRQRITWRSGLAGSRCRRPRRSPSRSARCGAGHRRHPGEPHHMIFARYLIRCVAYNLQPRKLMQANGWIRWYSLDSWHKVSTDNSISVPLDNFLEKSSWTTCTKSFQLVWLLLYPSRSKVGDSYQSIDDRQRA